MNIPLGNTPKTVVAKDCCVTVRKVTSMDGQEFVRVDVEIYEEAHDKVSICDFTNKSIEAVKPHSVNPDHVALAIRKVV